MNKSWQQPYVTSSVTPKELWVMSNIKRALCNTKRDPYHKSYEKRPTSYAKNPISRTQRSMSRHVKRALWNTKRDLYHKSHEKRPTSYDLSCDLWYRSLLVLVFHRALLTWRLIAHKSHEKRPTSYDLSSCILYVSNDCHCELIYV